VKYLKIITLSLAFACLLNSPEAFADDLIHVVGRGDTVYSISRFYQVSAEELMRANGITDPSRLSLGKRLIIPGRSAAAPVSNSTSAQTLVNYRVERGDTLYSIARTNGITLQRLLEINGFPSNHTLRAGDVIKVPGRAGGSNNTAAASTPSNTPANLPSGIYAMRWPVSPKAITYMTGQMGVVVEGEQFESVRSLTQGSVVSAGPWRKFGRVIIVETSGGYFYMYGGCETITVNVGDRITPGMELGKLGVNAVSERAQLFFMVFRNDKPVDPAIAPRASAASSGAANSGAVNGNNS